jgi:hypothetical protein
MKHVEFYSKAQVDPLFRRQKIEESQYQKRIALGFAVVIVAGWLSYLAYCEIREGRWPGDGGVLLLLVICASLYSQARTRLGALQSIQPREPPRVPASAASRL